MNREGKMVEEIEEQLTFCLERIQRICKSSCESSRGRSKSMSQSSELEVKWRNERDKLCFLFLLTIDWLALIDSRWSREEL